MIRDPSDGSVKTKVDENAGLSSTRGAKPSQSNDLMSSTTRPTSANNWGLKSLDKEARKPKPAPTAEELRAHYAKHNLAFRPKTEEF